MLLLAAGALLSCSNNDDSPSNVTAADFSTAISENPQQGDQIGVISASTTEGVTFAITASEPSGAFAVNPTTGELTVADPAAFDFESRSQVTGTVSISNGESTAFSIVNIALTNADDILTLLTTSRAAYEAETSGWIQITEEEYDLLAERMAEITKVGVPEFNYPSASDGEFIDNIVVSNSINMTIPAESYFFAFRYFAEENVPEAQVRPKISEQGPITGFVGRGPLPPHSAGDVFFVKKGDTQRTQSSASYMALYSPYSMGWVSSNDNTLYYRLNGNGSDLPLTASTFLALQQGLTTKVLQWD